MRLQIHIGDEGPTDLDLKDGDIEFLHPNSWTPGTEELKKWLIVELPEYGGTQSELTEPEWAVGSPDAVIRRARKYYVPYWLLLTQDDIATVRDPLQSFAVFTDTDKIDLWSITRK